VLVGDEQVVLAGSHKAVCIGTKQLGGCGSVYIPGVAIVSHLNYPSGEAGFIGFMEAKLDSGA
jgi:hypothetical protein